MYCRQLAKLQPLMRRKDLFVCLGSEDTGLSPTFLDASDHLLAFDCLSASINVAACFAAVDTVIKIARRTGGHTITHHHHAGD